jgi:hypothetical protein
MFRRTVLTAALAVAALLAGTPAAFADLGGQNPPPPPTTSPPPQASQGNGSGSGAQHTTSGACSLYSNSSSFGYSCLSGTGVVTTVKEVLKGDPVPTCWDERISAQDAVDKYDLDLNDGGGPYYLHRCLSHIDPNRSVYQTGIQLGEQIIPIPGGQQCPPGPYKDEYFEKCVYSLTTHQQALIDFFQNGLAYIPGITIASEPALDVRTNVETVFRNEGMTDNYNRHKHGGRFEVETAHIRAGGVELWAQLDNDAHAPLQLIGPNPTAQPGTGFAIWPTGYNAADPAQGRIRCDGSLPVPDNSAKSRSQYPDACWYKYRRSSADQPNQAYAFHAEASWTVYFRDGQGVHVLGHYTKTYDVPLPVHDVQVLNTD